MHDGFEVRKGSIKMMSNCVAHCGLTVYLETAPYQGLDIYFGAVLLPIREWNRRLLHLQGVEGVIKNVDL